MKKSIKKTLGIVLTALLLCGFVAGCSQSITENPEQSVTPNNTSGESGKEEITITFWDGNWQEEAWAEVEAKWNEEYPHITVEAEFQADLANDKYMLALTNGTAPDVLSCALDWVTTFGSAGLLAPLNEFVEKDNVDTSNFVEGAIDAATIDGNLYGLPFRSETYVMFYNKDILEAAGYTKAPETWDEVKEIAAAVTNDDVFGYGLCGTNYSNFSFQYITMLRSSGGSILNVDGTSALANDAAVKTAQLYSDLKEFAPASLLENDNIANRTLFASGKVAMYMSGIYDLEEIIKINPDLNFACAMVPTAADSERGSILGGWSVAVAGSSKEQEAAWTFVNFLTRPDIAEIYTNTFTGTADIAARYKDYPDDIIAPNAEALEYASALPTLENIVGIRQAIFENLQPMLIDGMSAEEATARLEEVTNNLIN
jgi:ABC-type sugar transport system, periplasmic component